MRDNKLGYYFFSVILMKKQFILICMYNICYKKGEKYGKHISCRR